MSLTVFIAGLIDLASKILGYETAGKILGAIKYVIEKKTDVRVKAAADETYQRYQSGWEDQKSDRS